uniref:Uncharacterized protein n=1 Tax=Ascaris lumbricoides TaxID=6252 RepID=A0A0M3IX17_ASCLU
MRAIYGIRMNSIDSFLCGFIYKILFFNKEIKNEMYSPHED